MSEEQRRIEELEDALDHIKRVALASRTKSKRDKWIAWRAYCALIGSEAWKDDELPNMEGNLDARVGRVVFHYIDRLNDPIDDAQQVVDMVQMLRDINEIIVKHGGRQDGHDR